MVVFEVQIEENHENDAFKNSVFFACVFLSILGGVGTVLGGFWEGIGGFVASLGPLLASFFDAYILNALQKGSWSLLGSILAPF